jgi:excisionase family DNA binding protein
MAKARTRRNAKGKERATSAAGNPAETVLTLDELAGYLRLAKSTAYKLAQEGKIPGQKVGRHWRFHKAAIDRWLGDHSRAAGPR